MVKSAPIDDQGDEQLVVSSPAREAAGVRGVAISLRHVHDEVGFVRGARVLLDLNQADGFDCPGCAWPEPHDRSRLEFCENGAKAVAEEATRRRVGPAFFAAHPLSELRERSDHWLGQQGRLTAPVYKAPGDDHYRPVGWSAAFGIVA